MVTVGRFGKPFFANVHHHVYAVAEALWKPNVACPHPDGLHWYWMTSVMVMRSTLSSHSADASVLNFRRPNGFFLHFRSSLKRSY